MEAPHGAAPSPLPWIAAVASMIPLAAAWASDSPPPAPPAFEEVTTEQPAETAELSTEAVPWEGESPAPALPLARGDAARPLRVLVVGDSHTAGTFGRALDLLLRSLPNTEVLTVGSCGLSPDGFLESKTTRCGFLQIQEESFHFQRRLRTPHIDDLLAAHKPDLTIVELGANQIHTAARDPRGAAKDIRRLVDKIEAAGSRVLWVGPPYGEAAKKPPPKLEHVYEVLAATLPGRIKFVDSRPSAMPFLDWDQIVDAAGKRGDGKHFDTLGVYGQQASRRWAMAVFEAAQPLLFPEAFAAPRVVLAEAPLVLR